MNNKQDEEIKHLCERSGMPCEECSCKCVACEDATASIQKLFKFCDCKQSVIGK